MAILTDEQKIRDMVRADLIEMKNKYADARRSFISDEEVGDYDKEALIREENMVVTVTHDGYIKRLPPSTYRAQGRGGRGITATNTKEGDFLEHMFVVLTHDYILFFTDKGKVYWLKVYDVPIATRTAGGRAIVNLLQLGEGERITGMVPVRQFREDECLLMVTRRGTVKKTELVAFKRPLGRGIIALGLEENDELIGRGAGEGRRPRDSIHSRGNVDPVRRGAGACHGAAGLRRQGHRACRRRPGDRHGGRQRRRRPRQPAHRLREWLWKTHAADGIPLTEPRWQGSHRHSDQRGPQRPGRRGLQGDRGRRGHAVDQRRHGHSHPACHHADDRAEHAGRPVDQAR